MTILSTLLASDAGSMTPLADIVSAVRKALPPAARPERSEVIALLSQDGYRLAYLNHGLHVAGVKLV